MDVQNMGYDNGVLVKTDEAGRWQISFAKDDDHKIKPVVLAYYEGKAILDHRDREVPDEVLEAAREYLINKVMD